MNQIRAGKAAAGLTRAPDSYMLKNTMSAASRPKRESILPTRAELRILQALWEIGEGTIEQVVENLPPNASVNYKTVQTLLRIMEQKKFVRHSSRGRAFVFTPCATREEVNRRYVRDLLDQSYGGSPAELMVNLLEAAPVKESELDELEELIWRFRAERRE